MFLSITMFGIGAGLMMCSDCQKYFQLELMRKYPNIKKDYALITNGFFTRIRNPNYLGEILIYLSFAVLTGNPLSYKILLADWSMLFTSFLFMKEMSLSKKKGWKKYRSESNLLLPRLFSSKSFDTLAWIAIFAGGFYFHKHYDKILGFLKTQ
jgi:protein-S-isoprenylcysteine O-methyltransferase Ste14